ncbi:MAG: DUF4296 domain-containing protein [Chitinophagaceae bacterium]
MGITRVKYWCYVALALVVNACTPNTHPNKPDGFIETIPMSRIVWDITRADEYVFGFQLRDSAFSEKLLMGKARAEIFKIHKVTAEQFVNSYKYYQQYPDLQKALYDSIMSLANKEGRSFIPNTSTQ